MSFQWSSPFITSKLTIKNGEKWSKMPFDFKKLKDIMLTWNSKIDQGGGWQALFWNNHDQPWALNRFGDTGKYHNKSAEMLALALSSTTRNALHLYG